MDIGTFFVQQAIIHQIPQAKMAEKTDNPPDLSDVPCRLDNRQKAYFQARIRRSLDSAFDVEHDASQTSPVPGLMASYFGGTGGRSAFVKLSQDVASHLHQSQGGMSPAGLVAVVEGTIGTGNRAGKCLVVMKLELEPGVHVERVVTDKGEVTFDVMLEDVTLTERTRVFKVGLFQRFASVGILQGLASDDQLDSSTIGREIAEFFLGRFLGCRVKETPNVATKRVFDKATEFINTVGDQEKKLQYEAALHAELQSNSPTLNLRVFARRHLDEDDRDPFLARFAEADGSVRPVQKDLELVKARVTKFWVELTNGVRVTGPPEAVHQTVAAIRAAKDKDGRRIVDADVSKVR